MRQRMERRQLKALVESGDYKPDPALIAQAMLSRRGVRELLTGGGRQPSDELPSRDGLPTGGGLPLSPTGRTQSAAQAPRQAA